MGKFVIFSNRSVGEATKPLRYEENDKDRETFSAFSLAFAWLVPVARVHYVCCTAPG
jgi:hypothetical protein